MCRVPSDLLFVVFLNLSPVENDAGDLRATVGDRMTNFTNVSRALTGHVLSWDLKANASHVQALAFKHDVANVHYKAWYSRHGVPAESTPIQKTLYLISL